MSETEAIIKNRDLSSRAEDLYHRLIRASLGAHKVWGLTTYTIEAGDLALAAHKPLGTAAEKMKEALTIIHNTENGSPPEDGTGLEKCFKRAESRLILSWPTATSMAEMAEADDRIKLPLAKIAEQVKYEVSGARMDAERLRPDLLDLAEAIDRETGGKETADASTEGAAEEAGPESRSGEDQIKVDQDRTVLTTNEFVGVLGTTTDRLEEVVEHGGEITSASGSERPRNYPQETLVEWRAPELPDRPVGREDLFVVPNDVLRRHGAESMISEW